MAVSTAAEYLTGEYTLTELAITEYVLKKVLREATTVSVSVFLWTFLMIFIFSLFPLKEKYSVVRRIENMNSRLVRFGNYLPIVQGEGLISSIMLTITVLLILVPGMFLMQTRFLRIFCGITNTEK